MSAIAKLLEKAPAPLVALTLSVVKAILGAKDPEGAARRAEEAVRRGALDEALKKAKPRKKR